MFSFIKCRLCIINIYLGVFILYLLLNYWYVFLNVINYCNKDY